MGRSRNLAGIFAWPISQFLGVRRNPVLDDRSNFVAPFAAVEDAIMSDFGRQVIFLVAIGKASGDI